MIFTALTTIILTIITRKCQNLPSKMNKLIIILIVEKAILIIRIVINLNITRAEIRGQEIIRYFMQLDRVGHWHFASTFLKKKQTEIEKHFF